MNRPPNAGGRPLFGLYPIVDLDRLRVRGIDAGSFAQAILASRPAILQVRAKTTPAGETLGVLTRLLPECHAAGALLFANDRPDLAVLAGCDGVHVGQLDLPIQEVRRFDPKLRVGVSTHDLVQLSEALEHKPDYVAFGPVFTTTSKEDPDPVVGMEGLRHAHRKALAAGVPLVAIGGISLERVAELSGAAEMIAVIGALLQAEPTLDGALSVAKEFQAAFGAPAR